MELISLLAYSAILATFSKLSEPLRAKFLLDMSKLEAHLLAKGNVEKVVNALIAADKAAIPLTFKRATGILTGTCCIWYEGTNAKGAFEQKYYSNCKHAGVFLMCRDADDLLPDDTVTAGALIVPQTIKLPNGSKRTWNANFRFNVKSMRREMDWGD